MTEQINVGDLVYYERSGKNRYGIVEKIEPIASFKEKTVWCRWMYSKEDVCNGNNKYIPLTWISYYECHVIKSIEFDVIDDPEFDNLFV